MRFKASPLVFIALAISILPTGTRDVMALSMTPSQVIIAITDTAPEAIAHVETVNAPGMPFARLADVAPAAMTMAINNHAPFQRGPFSRSTRIEPTAMICARPRIIAIRTSLSRWIPRLRASNTTNIAATAATAACPRTRCRGLPNKCLSMQYLSHGSDANYVSTLKHQCAVGESRGLGFIVSHYNASELVVAHNVAQ